MNAVMLSIRPEWCEKIAIREKTIEVRKSKPKLETPFKCYIYQTKHKWVYRTLEKLHLFKWARAVMAGQGYVIGEFVCDRITPIPILEGRFVDVVDCRTSCLSAKKIIEYANGDRVYGWHISELKIYDKPKELSEFLVEADSTTDYPPLTKMKRPPQSWCYVEGLALGGGEG